MASDSSLMSLVIKDYKPIFEGLDSLVDIEGSIGTMARIIYEAFPHMKCKVLDLPRVVANLPDGENLKYISGDMFQSIPYADAILTKVWHIFRASFSTRSSPIIIFTGSLCYVTVSYHHRIVRIMIENT
ncbi:hypothetical protein SO802_021025 [Lithocarpus litseifolius]|uniref:O-methyltransferase C-terminal domain-containing protein n=1 Tax=Lithocarpus litseifolius TaxID=425828 RepID=A0AAW2CDP9_9ROSI